MSFAYRNRIVLRGVSCKVTKTRPPPSWLFISILSSSRGWEDNSPPGACQKSCTPSSAAGLRTSHCAPFFSLSAHLFLLCLFHAYQCVSLRGKCLRLNPNLSHGWYYPRLPPLLLPQQLPAPSITPSRTPSFYGSPVAAPTKHFSSFLCI